ncbi:phosphoglycerate kinase [Desulforhopalus sp. IMCC35007]|nr:phosphoglycerate kinase [Desulforhopalus sp. IMCC35007]
MQSTVDLQEKSKRVLLRADFNVPMDNERNRTDDFASTWYCSV